MAPAEIVTGTLAELEDALAETIASARADDRLAPVTVLVGHVLLKRYLPRMLAARGTAQMNVRFVRPHELAEELSPGADGERGRLSPAAERMLVRDVAATGGGYFAGIAGGDGFTDALLRLFRELELGGLGSPVELERALREAGPSANAEKFAALARLYGLFLARRDSAELIGAAEHYGLATIDRFEGPLLIYGVWAASELQMRLVEQIAAPHSVTAFFATSELDADEGHAAFRARLIAGGATQRRLESRGDATTIERVAAELFRGGNEAVVAPNVSLVSAPDTVREVWEAARTCLVWAREGIRFHEIAVVYRNSEPYRALVDEIFREAGISAYIHDGRLLSKHPLGVRLLALLDLSADPGFARQAVMEFLTETQLPPTTAAKYGRFRPSEWEKYTREAGVVAGIEQWRTRLGRLAAERTERAKDERFSWMAADAERIGVLERFAEDFHAALTAHASEGTWDEHLAFLRGLARAYADGIEPVIEALGDLKTIEPVAKRVTFETFCWVARDYLERRDASAVLGEPERLFGREGVAVLDATSLRHLRFRAVYMLGVAERAWPSPPRPDPLLLEHERAQLNSAGPGRVPLRTTPDDEELTFWLGLQAAREQLRLSYARSDSGGSGKHLPSYFFRAVAEALTGYPLTLAELDASEHVQRVEAGRLAHDDLAASLSAAEYDRGLMRGAIASGGSAAIDALVADTGTFGRAVEARLRRWSSDLTRYDGVMTGADAIVQAAKAEFGRVKAVSPSRLEMYATCPYRYFVRYTLGVDAVTDPEETERIDALERGSLVHAILERFLKEIGRDDPPRAEARERHLALLREVAAAEGREREARGVTGRPLIWAMDQRQIEDDLVRWYAAEMEDATHTALRPGAFEVGFGGARFGFGEESPLSTEEPIAIGAGDRELLLQGRIDRIDWDDARTAFRVIDYKTGKVRGTAKSMFDHGRALQLPVYLHAAAEALEMDPAAGKSQYFYVSSAGGYKRRSISGAELEQHRGELEQILSTISGGVDGGFFAPNPGGKNRPNCMYCEVKDICDTNIERLAERKRGDARGAAYIALEEIE